MEVNKSPGKTIRKIGTHRSSANKKPRELRHKKKIMHRGSAVISVMSSPAVITFLTFNLSFSALYLVISRETVMGVPEQDRVRRSTNTDSATWYKPIPSEPIERDKKIRYKKPKNFSLTENTVTTATVLKNFLKISPINLEVDNSRNYSIRGVF